MTARPESPLPRFVFLAFGPPYQPGRTLTASYSRRLRRTPYRFGQLTASLRQPSHIAVDQDRHCTGHTWLRNQAWLRIASQAGFSNVMRVPLATHSNGSRARSTFSPVESAISMSRPWSNAPPPVSTMPLV